MALLKDVAARAGVSTATVSRVLNAPHVVSERTRERVNAAIKALGYQPNRVARRLSGRHEAARMISLIIPDIQNPFYGLVARGVEDVANEHHCVLILGNADGNPDKEERYLNLMRAELVDGIIAPPISEQEESLIVHLVRDGLPVVSIDGPMTSVEIDHVLVDNVKGAYEAVEQLLKLNHRRIGFIGGPLHYLGFKERYIGYTNALADNGLPLDNTLIKVGKARPENALRLTHELLELSDRPTALFTADNLITTGALEAIYEHHLRIPADISLIGFDDIPVARAFHPPLSVVRQSAYKMGHTAARLLFQRLQDPGRAPVKVVLEPKLILRDSCAPVPLEDRTVTTVPTGV